MTSTMLGALYLHIFYLFSTSEAPFKNKRKKKAFFSLKLLVCFEDFVTIIL